MCDDRTPDLYRQIAASSSRIQTVVVVELRRQLVSEDVVVTGLMVDLLHRHRPRRSIRAKTRSPQARVKSIYPSEILLRSTTETALLRSESFRV